MSSKIASKLKQLILLNTLQVEEPNIYNIFRPFYVTLTLFGLFPYSVKYEKSENRFVIIPISLFINVLCAGFYATAMCVFCGVHIHNLFHPEGLDNHLTDVLLAQFNYLLEIAAFVGLCIVAYISAFLNRLRYVNILNSICAIWSKNNSRNEITERLRFQVNIVAIGSVVVLTIIHLFVNFSRDESLWKRVLVTFTAVIPSIIQTMVLAFHYVLVMMVVAILADINQQILEITGQNKVTEEIHSEAEIRRMKFSLSRLEEIYTKAFEIKTEINEVFQASLLFSTIQCFHCIVSEAYTIYHGVMEQKYTVHNMMNCSFWIVIQMVKIYSLTYSGNVLTKEAMKIGQRLHTIPTEKQSLNSFMEIQHFVALMKYRRFVLTVYGYFSLNATLMTIIIANVTMYLIILIQFDKSNITVSAHAAVM